MKESLKKVLEGILPHKFQLYVRYIYLKVFNKLDSEMLYVSKLLKDNRRFLDVGANVGVYSFHFSRSFKNVDAFEPIAETTYRLKALESDALKVHDIALSNKKGKLNFYIPLADGKPVPSLASLEKRDVECVERIVEVNTLDSYSFNDVDLMKIDVEGHEQSVILGAHETIKRCMPVLIVEIEQQHIDKRIDEVFRTILDMNYEGFFLQKDILTPLKEFDYEIHQKPFLQDVMAKEYVNNFIFVPNR